MGQAGLRIRAQLEMEGQIIEAIGMSNVLHVKSSQSFRLSYICAGFAQ